MSDYLHKFIYKLIGKPPAGLIPGTYICEFIELKTKKNSKGRIVTEIRLNIIKKST